MKKIITLFLISVIAISCRTAKSLSQNGDGSDYGNAIVISAKNESDGVAKEYDWLRTNFPGYKMVSQSVGEKNGKPYGILKIITASGEAKSVYFDISKFYGKF